MIGKKLHVCVIVTKSNYSKLDFFEVGARESITPKGGDGQLEKISQCRFDLRISASRDIKRINFVFELGRLSLLPSRLSPNLTYATVFFGGKRR